MGGQGEVTLYPGAGTTLGMVLALEDNMSMLMMLKEGGDLVLEAKGNTKLDEDLDLTLNESGGAGIFLL